MLGKRKPYDPLRAEYGTRAEREWRAKLVSIGYRLTEFPHGKYGPDLLAESDRERFFVEVERRGPDLWKSGPFPRRTVHVPERRNKGAEKNWLFFTFSRDVTDALVVFPQSLTSSRLREIYNNCVPSGEFFYDLPVFETLPLRLANLTWGDTFAELNVVHKRKQIEECIKRYGKKAKERCFRILGDEPPYGMTEEEWRQHKDDVERQIEKQIYPLFYEDEEEDS